MPMLSLLSEKSHSGTNSTHFHPPSHELSSSNEEHSTRREEGTDLKASKNDRMEMQDLVFCYVQLRHYRPRKHPRQVPHQKLRQVEPRDRRKKNGRDLGAHTV